MNSYNFSALNDKEFEALSVDLISQLVGTRVERFKAGRDEGIDGRFFSPDGGRGIVQCKHWLKSGFGPLLSYLKNDELPKINKLKPVRYLLTTTLPLSAAEKDKIQKALHPWILSPQDILGAEDITDLLGKYPTIEQRHFKLWLSSSSAIVAIFNAGILTRSSDRLREISDNAKKFVYTTFHEHAIQKLESLHTIVITGEPGAGKTCLADHLALEYTAKGFAAYFLEHSIQEAEDVYRPDTKQIFLFDDFLGRNYLQALERHEDTHVVNFIKRVGRDATKRFILTSRTTILNQGKQLADVFQIENVQRNEYQIEVRGLSDFDKASILY
ncbi:MAG TPA: restriction endonuclease, partial [Solimonas sp.]